MPKQIPQTPRINQSQTKARSFLYANKVASFPIDIKTLIKTTGLCVLKKYSSQIKKFGFNLDYLCNNFGTDGVTIFNPKRKKPYTILYNDFIYPPSRIYWTLAHELGLVLLRHNDDFDETKLSRNGLTEASYKILDDEADAFAAELLSPAIVLIAAGWLTKNDIQVHCKLSNTAARNRSKSLLAIKKVKTKYFSYEKQLFKSFYNHIYLNFCPECKTYFVSKEAKYCPICGKSNLIWKKGEENTMKYPGITVDENSKALVCPKCNNEEITQDGEFCMICGENIKNFCEGYINERGFQEEEGCGKELPGNARFCPYCGGMSHFYNKDFLTPWNKQPDPAETFGNSEAIFQIDEEIPF